MRPTAIVTGMIATYPVGGVVWDYAQYALGLERLGWDVYYLEDTGWQTYDPDTGQYGEDPAYGVAFLGRSLAALSPALGRRWHVVGMDGRTYGLPAPEFAAAVRAADLFLNVSGGTLLRDAYMACPCKVLVDTDPGYNHFVNFPKWDANPNWHGSHGYRAHDHFLTYAERIGRPDCPLPTFGLPWQPTRPPVVTDAWQGHDRAVGERWTTVMTWDNFRKPIEHAGVTYGTKEREFGKVEGLPRRLGRGVRLEVASGGDPPVERWRSLGWSVIDAHAASRTADAYRDYVCRSRGEFSVAKNVYVATGCGWFSCRTVCYLAAGRPAVVQDTGFSEIIPTGRGLFAFDDVEQAAAAVRAVEADYPAHSAAARAVAAEHFAADRVIGDLLRRVGL